MSSAAPIPDDYSKVLAQLKERVRTAWLAAVRSVNTQLLTLLGSRHYVRSLS